MFIEKQKYEIHDLIEIMRTLRADDGCPWDKEQSHATIRMNVLEEAYEVAEAIDSGSPELLKEELGDLLLQIIFHSQISAESGGFRFEEVCDVICRKLIYRHPHIFASLDVSGTDEVLRNWEALKSKSKGEQSAADSLENVPKTLPALMRGEKVGKRAANLGFDFENTAQVIARLREEIDELEEAYNRRESFTSDESPESVKSLEFADLTKINDEIEEEFGDILFTCCNLSRFLQKVPEKALTSAINKFIMRFRAVEALASRTGQTIAELPQSTLDELWEKAKER
ncbi:MAG: nucleoside triphosphate pyrophosphohydrolase [Oscillospiraceae bacterium]|nr:nucleoside triphosphate pyrophosphohydrolase [Oscillospiraceae bacterium]